MRAVHRCLSVIVLLAVLTALPARAAEVDAKPLEVMRGAQVQPMTVTSGDRFRYLRLNPTYWPPPGYATSLCAIEAEENGAWTIPTSR